MGELSMLQQGVWLSDEEYSKLKEEIRARGCRKTHSRQKYLKNAPVRKVAIWYDCNGKTLKMVVVHLCGARAPKYVYVEKVEWV